MLVAAEFVCDKLILAESSPPAEPRWIEIGSERARDRARLKIGGRSQRLGMDNR